MQSFFGFVSSVLGIYSLLLIARIILTWFSRGYSQSGVVQFLTRITDPYLNWWRQHFNLRAGFLDLTPLAALATLNVLQSIFASIAAVGTITLGVILAIILHAVWSMVAFLLWFCIIVLAIRLVGYFMNRGTSGHFWHIVSSISEPIRFRITQALFRNRILNFVTSIVVSMSVIFAVWLIGRTLLRLLLGVLVTPTPEQQYMEDPSLFGLLAEMLARHLT